METTQTTQSAPRASKAAEAAIPGLPWKIWTGVWMTVGILAAFLWVGPVLSSSGQPMFTMGGHGAKAFFFHMPNAWLATITYVTGAWYAVRYLRTPRTRGMATANDDDLKSAVSMELGLLFSLLAAITGSLFARNEWGAYWVWTDPRMVSILVIMLIFAAYLVLRGAIEEPEKRARLSAAYALVAAIPGLFLIWVLPRIVPTLHDGPNNAVVGGGLGGNVRIVLYSFIMPAFIGLFVWLFQLRLRLMRLESRAMNAYIPRA
jgi:heme exporter protein C